MMEQTRQQHSEHSDDDNDHQSYGSNIETQGQYTTSSEGAEYSIVTENQAQQKVSASQRPQTTSVNQSFAGAQGNNSFHSFSSGGSTVEMAGYFPNTQTPNTSSSSYGLQQLVGGQTQSTAASNTAVTTNTNTVNVGSYLPVSAPHAVRPLTQPPRTFMAQQQQQQQRPAGQPQRPQGIPSYASQIEGLSVSQAVVNDVLVDLQTKVLNESFQQNQDDGSNGLYLEPLPPIFIRAPQPTVILQSDLNRLRAELRNRVRPPVVYRYPANQFQRNQFQAPRFPTPPQPFNPQGYYGQYPNTAYASSGGYNVTTTTATSGDGYQNEKEEGVYNQAESTMFNDSNITDNVHSTFDRQGLSTTPFDRHASSYASSSFPSNFVDQQQHNEETAFTSSQYINNEQVGSTDNMFSRPGRPRQEVTFDINNCIQRCFEAHRERVARRRAARQARRERRHKQSGGGEQQQQQYQPFYHTEQYQNFSNIPTYSSTGTTQQTQWQQQQQFSTNLPSDLQSSQEPYIPISTYDYTNVGQTTNFSSDIVDAHTNQLPFSSLSTTNIDNTVPINIESSGAANYQYRTIDTQQQQQQQFLSSNEYQYTPEQIVPSTNTADFVQQQTATSYDYSNQVPYDAYSSTDGIVSNNTQNVTADYYQQQQQQQQQVPSQLNQNIEQQSYDYAYNVDNLQTSQIPNSYSQPTGTYEYSHESYQIQQPIYDTQSADTQQVIQQDTYNYATTASTSYVPTQNETNINGQTQSYEYPYNIESQSQAFDSSNYYQQSQQQQPTETFDYTGQTFDSSTYYQQQQQPTANASETIQDSYGQPTRTYEYSRESYHTQEPVYNYSNIDQQSSDYSYNVQETQQTETLDYGNQALTSTDQYQEQQPVSVPVEQTYESQYFDNRISGGSIPTGTVEYTREAYYSQEPISDTYTTENFIQQQESESLNINDYLKRFESDSYSPQTGGQLQSSIDNQSINTVTTTPFVIQPNVDTYQTQGAKQTYDLQNYTNEILTSEPSHAQQILSNQEEDQKYLLQQTEQHTEFENSINETYNSLPPPPTAEEIAQYQESIKTNTSDFPPPPSSDRYNYETIQQQQQQILLPPTSPNSHGTDEDVQEDEEIFDLRQCIANCYAKYEDSWNKDEQQRYQQRLQDIQQESVSNINTTNQQEQSGQYVGTGEIHYIDGWTQTPSLDVITQSDIVQHKYDETPSSYDTKPYIPDFAKRGLSTDSREQQTIEYSPPLTTPIRPIHPKTPASPYDYSHRIKEQQQQQQQQPLIYDHTLPVPPHLSFNDADYQSNLYFSSQITAQPRQYENIPFDTTFEQQQQQQQQRYRAYSEPASTQQESVTSIQQLQSAKSQIITDDIKQFDSTPMVHQAPVRFINNGRAYETDATFERRVPQIDPKTGLCLVPCPHAQKYAHLPPHLRPELFCVELPPPSTLPPVPPPPPPPPPRPVPPQVQGQQRWCVRCCCVPGQTLIKKIVYKQVEEAQQEEAGFDYGSVINQLGTRINVRYGNSYMEEGDAFVSGNYNEQLRVIDFPVYVSGKDDPNLTPLIPTK